MWGRNRKGFVEISPLFVKSACSGVGVGELEFAGSRRSLDLTLSIPNPIPVTLKFGFV